MVYIQVRNVIPPAIYGYKGTISTSMKKWQQDITSEITSAALLPESSNFSFVPLNALHP